MEEYIVLIADVIESRKLNDRYLAQRKIISIIELFNEVYFDYLRKKVEISSGDSLQGIFKTLSAAFLYARAIQLFLYPIKLKIGIGLGVLDYFDESFSSNMLDGKAYHNAKKALDIISENKYHSHIYFEGNEQFDFLNSYIDLYDKTTENLSYKSQQVFLLSELLNPLSIDKSVHYIKYMNEEMKKLVLGDIQFVDNNKGMEIKEMNILNIVSHSNNEASKYKSTIERGIAVVIAELLGTSRQNIQRYLSKELAEERYYAIKLCKHLLEI